MALSFLAAAAATAAVNPLLPDVYAVPLLKLSADVAADAPDQKGQSPSAASSAIFSKGRPARLSSGPVLTLPFR